MAEEYEKSKVDYSGKRFVGHQREGPYTYEQVLKWYENDEEAAKAEWALGEVFYEPVGEEEDYSGKKYDGWNHDEGPYSWSEYLKFYETEEEAKKNGL